jgi:hypothetical protein
VQEVTGVKTVNLAGCPPNADNMVATIGHFLLLGKLPALDAKGRPLFAYGQLIHDNCERRGHYEAEEFVKEFGDEGPPRVVPPQGGVPRSRDARQLPKDQVEPRDQLAYRRGSSVHWVPRTGLLGQNESLLC